MPIVVPSSTARTLGDLKTRVADELARADLASQIALAVEDAITEAATNRFWFNEVRGLTLSTAIGQEVYGSDEIAALTQIDSLWISVSGGRRNLREASAADLDRLVQGTQPTGEPYMFARYGGFIRLYPVPQQVYTVTIDGVSRLFTLADDADANAWTDQNCAERYIRAVVKRNILAEIICDFERAQAQGQLADGYKNSLLAQTYDRTATGAMAAHG